MKRIWLILLSAIFMVSCTAKGASAKELRKTVSPFNVERYLGKWYEIARFDVSFERGLNDVTAEYSLMPNGRIKVLNSGVNEKGIRDVAEGKAKIPNMNNPSHLKVSFFWFFYADYLVLYLDQENYSYALVGSTSDKYLWILSRTPELPKKTLDEILNKAKSLGYDTSKLYFTKQDIALGKL